MGTLVYYTGLLDSAFARETGRPPGVDWADGSAVLEAPGRAKEAQSSSSCPTEWLGSACDRA